MPHNGCYKSPGLAQHQCQQLGCTIDEDKHTFSQSCHSADPSVPIILPDCPPGWGPDTTKVAVGSSRTDTGGGSGGGSASVCFSDIVCVPMPIMTTAPLSTTMQSTTMQSTTPNTLPPFEHIGTDGCPEGFTLKHNNGSLFFDCPNQGGCGTSCDQDGNCTTSCSSAESSCQDALASGKSFVSHKILS